MIDGAAAVRLYRVPEAMALLSLSRSVFYEQIRAGRLRSVTQGRTRRVPATAIADESVSGAAYVTIDTTGSAPASSADTSIERTP